MAKPRVLLLRAPGTNCEEETAYAFQLAGAETSICHINALIDNPGELKRNQVFCIPGGFGYGDDVSAGQVIATQLRHHLIDEIKEFHEHQKLILGICNGFQVLIKSGLLMTPDQSGSRVTLTWNDNGRYTDCWVNLRPHGNRCVFLRGIDTMYLPIAHGEGKFFARDDQTLDELDSNGQLALRYDSDANPNGSMRDVAGLCDATGRVFGLMPHPERHVHSTHHPKWTRNGLGANPDGLSVFRNAVAYFG